MQAVRNDSGRGFRNGKGNEKNEFGLSLQLCTNHYCVGYGARPGAQKLNAFKVCNICVVHYMPLLELNNDLH